MSRRRTSRRLPREARQLSPRIPALAYCQGTPLRSEIEARDKSRLGEATDVAAEAIAKRFGARRGRRQDPGARRRGRTLSAERLESVVSRERRADDRSRFLPSDQWPSLPLEAWSDTYATLALVDADRRQGSRRPVSVGESFLACHAARHGQRAHHVAHPVRRSDIPDRLRLHPPFAHGAIERREDRTLQARAPIRRHVLRTPDGADGESSTSTSSIHRKPNEVADPIPFDQDESHAAYDREYANRFWRMLVQADRVLTEFRARFIGKCSPVHFFWGAPDLAVTRFSGRRAPEHPGGSSQSAGHG